MKLHGTRTKRKRRTRGTTGGLGREVVTPEEEI
jgi:hypothetical protein